MDWTVREGQIQDYIDELKLYEDRYAADSECSYAIMRERHTAEMVRFYVRRERARTKMNIKIGSVATFLGIFTGKAGDASAAIGGVNDLLSGSEGSYNAIMLENLLIELDQRTLIRKRSCEHTDMEEIMKKTRKTAKVNALIDPSGIVYEAVESNTLSDVKATIWYADDANGTNARIWNAQDYDQINPQITDKAGAYAWDVLSGWWQVRFEKDGYESTQTEWMEVPPPRVGLKTAMISKALPEVEAARAYPDYIELMFSQYMDTSKQLTLPAGMSAEWQNVEDGYSKVLHITRTGGFTLGETVSVTVDGAYNYAGKALSAYNSGNLTVSARPAEILLNYENTISVQAGTTRNLTVRVKDSEGNVMSGAAVDAVIGNTDFAGLTAQSVLTDKDGKAVFVMNAQLPGYTDITFKVNGTSLTKSAELHVTVDENRPKRPTAQIGTTQFAEDAPKENYITVQSGGQLVLTAEEGVTIYYTTDDTCPCQNSDSRMVYTGPVTIKKNTKFRIAAYKEGMDYSERLNITVTVENGIMPGDVNGDGTVNLLDAQMTLKAALKIIALTDDQKEAADVDGKGGVTLADAQLILKYALKIINTFI